MKRLYFFLILITVGFILKSTKANGQQRKKTGAKKHNTRKSLEYTSPVFTNEEDLKKWLFQDSVKRAFSDSVQAIKDSIRTEEELKKYYEAFEKVYAQYHYPTDSLSYVDRQVNAMTQTWKDITADSACLLISQKFSSPLQKARAIFHWVASRIHYDWFSYSHGGIMPIYNRDEDAVRTFKYRSGVCQNYSNLYEYMCRKTGVECIVINGWGKNFPICISGDTDKSPNHAWNAIRIKNKWMLLDATWASVDTSGVVDHYWFNTPPEEFIYNHLPEDSSFQLLKKGITKTQFSNYPIVSESLFKSKFDFEIPENGSFILRSNKFSISVPIELKGYEISYSLIRYYGTQSNAYNNPYLYQQDVETIKTTDAKKETNIYQVTLPSKGIWWISADIIKKIKNPNLESVGFYGAIMFKVNYE